MKLITKDIKPGCLIFENQDILGLQEIEIISRALVLEKTTTKIKLYWINTEVTKTYNLIDIEWFFISKDPYKWKIFCP